MFFSLSEKQYRAFLAFLAFSVGALGLVLVIYNSVNPSNEPKGGRIAGVQEVQLVQNAPLELTPFDPIRSQSNFNWGTNIRTWKTVTLNKPILGFNTGQGYIIGELQKDRQFEKLFTLEEEPDLLNVYNSDNIAYILKDSFTQTQVLVLQSKSDQNSYLLPVDADITSILYDPSQSIFYFTSYSSNGEFILYAMLNNSEMIELERSSNISRFTHIAGVKDSFLYFKNDSSCYQFDQYTRTFSKGKCNTIFNDLGEPIIEETSTEVFLHQDSNLQLVSNVNNVEKQAFHQIYQKKLYFLRYSRDSIEEKELHRINFGENSDEKLLELPNKYVSESFMAYSTFFFTDGTKLYYYDPSIPSETPASYPNSYLRDLPENWHELDLMEGTIGITLLNRRIQYF